MSTDHPHVHSGEPVEQDAVSFSGIGWFVVILVGTTLACQLIVWGLFEFSEWRVARSDAPRAALAEPATSPAICGETGEVLTASCDPEDVDAAPRPGFPTLLVREPTYLGRFRAEQREMQDTYGWIDQTMGTVRLPIERAKDLVLERGLPSRPAPAAAAEVAPTAAPAPAPAPTPAAAPSAPQH